MAQVKRRIGPAWLERDRAGAWVRRRGRPPEGFYDERAATVRAAEVAAQYVSDAANAAERAARAAALEAARGLTFRRIANDYLAYVMNQGRKPATIRDYERLLAEPGTPSLRKGRPAKRGLIMAALGDLPASEITARQIREFLDSLAEDGAGPRSVNISHALIRAIYLRAMQDDAPRQVEHNPAAKIKPGPSVSLMTSRAIRRRRSSRSRGRWRRVSTGPRPADRRVPRTTRTPTPPTSVCAWVSCWSCAGRT